MSSNKTQGYGLHLWEAGDDFLRSEFNDNFAAVDAALGGLEAGKARVVAGAYIGDGAASRFIDLGFTPAAVIVTPNYPGFAEVSTSYGGIALPGRPAYTYWSSVQPVLSVTEGGFLVYCFYRETTSIRSNDGERFYVAFR